MPQSLPFLLPVEKLRKLEFMIGEYCGLETLYPPNGTPVQFTASFKGTGESCERYFKIEFYGEVPGVGAESFTGMITYSFERECYRMWAFASSQEEPLHLTGDFMGTKLVLVSDPTEMIWGFQRLRFSLTPESNDSFALLGERWEPDGYAKYCSATFRSCDV